MNLPRILIAGLRGGSGKTIVSLGIAAAWQKRGRRVAPFKKGPDYIDAAWLSMAAGRACRNLDLFLTTPETAVRSFITWAPQADVAVIEGNRGLYDGMDARGSYSTAELAKLLRVPVVLAVDCTKSTRTVAATVLGCQKLDPGVAIAGVVLNQTAGPRHESVLRSAVEEICGLPVLGGVARLNKQIFPERHLGLVPPEEHGQLAGAIDRVAELAEQHLDLDALWTLAEEAGASDLAEHVPGWLGQSAAVPQDVRSGASGASLCSTASHPSVRIGVLRDAAFGFYYPENLEALAREGGEVIEVSPLRDPELPEVDGLYIGGGFPETLATALAENASFRNSLRRMIERGLPVYAECGGAVYLGETLVFDGQKYPMAGVLPVDFVFHKKMQGHGYAELETVAENPFYPVGKRLRGHEFHYTCIEPPFAKDLTFAFRVRRGYGYDGRRDGLCRGNVLACYTHVHALGTESWAPSVVRAAQRFKAIA